MTAIVLVALCGCQTVTSVSPRVNPGSQLQSTEAAGQTGGRIDALELQSLVMGMADDYGSEIAEIVYLLLKPVAESASERVLAQSYVRNSFGAAAEIATGPNPEVGLLDLLVLVSLQRATFERHWIPEVWGEERGGPALARLQKLESDLWARSDFFLSGEQQATLRSLIDAWLRDNPDRFVVELARFEQFADARHISNLQDRQAASGLLKEVGRAVGAIDDALLFGERALWYSGRLVYILGQQTELTMYRVLSDPQIEGALAAVGGFKESSDRAVETFETLPELLRTELSELTEAVTAERKATIGDFFDRLQTEGEQVSVLTGGLIDRIFLRLGLLIGAAFLGILVVRTVRRQ